VFTHKVGRSFRRRRGFVGTKRVDKKVIGGEFRVKKRSKRVQDRWR
jgi:hypothetical protein